MEPNRQKTPIELELEAAAVSPARDGSRGYHAVGPDGQLVILRPGTLTLAASVERGVVIDGLKDGWRLATAGDVKLAAAMEAKRQAEEGRSAVAAGPAGPCAPAGAPVPPAPVLPPAPEAKKSEK